MNWKAWLGSRLGCKAPRPNLKYLDRGSVSFAPSLRWVPLVHDGGCRAASLVFAQLVLAAAPSCANQECLRVLSGLKLSPPPPLVESFVITSAFCLAWVI